MSTEQTKDMERMWTNFHTSPYWNGILNKEQVNIMLQKHGDTMYCNGHLRQVVVDALTPNLYKVYTKRF